MNSNRNRPVRKRVTGAALLGGRAVLVAVVVLVFGPIAFAVATSATSAPSRGPIPESAWRNGSVDRTQVPDFIPVEDSSGKTVGWAAAQQAIPLSTPMDGPVPVYGDDLKTVVGSVYPGVGYVPLGVNPSSIARIPVTVSQLPPLTSQP